MRELPVLLPTPQRKPSAGIWRDVCFFLIAFGAVFLSALLVLDGAVSTLIG